MTDTSTLSPDIAALLKRDEHGLVAAVVQQHDTGDVLMVGWMDDEALRRTLGEGRVTFWSRSRQEYWRKGDTSGHVQWVKGVRLDCDGDALLVSVDQVGAACHTGDRTCFDGDEQRITVAVEPDALDPLDVTARVALAPVLLPAARPEGDPPLGEGAAQRLVVHPADHQHLTGARLLHHGGHQPVPVALEPGGDGRVERRWGPGGLAHPAILACHTRCCAAQDACSRV